MAMAAVKLDAETTHERSPQAPSRFIPQLTRYFTVSVIALALDMGVFTALCAAHADAPIAGAVGYAFGMIGSYVLSSTFVFDVEHSRKFSPRRVLEFICSGLLGLILTTAVISVLTTDFALSPLAAKSAAVAVSFLVVFLMRRWIVFAPAPTNN